MVLRQNMAKPVSEFDKLTDEERAAAIAEDDERNNLVAVRRADRLGRMYAHSVVAAAEAIRSEIFEARKESKAPPTVDTDRAAHELAMLVCRSYTKESRCPHTHAKDA